jgi:hypothetical protein
MLVDKQKLELHLIVFVPIKRPLKFRLNVKEACKEMLMAGLKKVIHPKPTDLGFWKKG